MAMSPPTVSIIFLLLWLLPSAVSGRKYQDRIRFKHWFPYYRVYFQTLLPNCSKVLDAYYVDAVLPECHSNCACVIDCLIGAANESVKSNMQSASIALGLMPTIIAILAPSIAEMAVLSTWSPLLAILTSFGSPAVRYGNRPDVLKILEQQDSKSTQRLQMWLERGRQRRWIKKAILYTAALAAVANIVEVSIRVDFRTASGWRCNQLFMPLVWSELSIAPFGAGMVAMLTRKAIQSQQAQPLQQLPSATGRKSKAKPMSRQPPAWQLTTKKEDTAISEFFWSLALLAAIVQSFFGVLVFASLIFISLEDAVPVFIRYAASCAVCRLIVAIELADLRVELGKTSHE